MSAGDAPAGSYPAGYDAILVSARALQTIGAAPKFDPYNRVYIFEADLTLEMDHPVMHRVAHLLGLPLGSLPSTPSDGFDVQAVKRSTKSTAQKTAEDAVRRAIKVLLDAGDVEIVDVTAVTKPAWRGEIITDIKNLRAPNAKPQRFRLAGAT